MNAHHSQHRNGLTLSELLIVIAIILVLSTLALAVMRSAQEDALESATAARIEMIETMLQTALEDYEVRRLPISNAELIRHVRQNPIASTPPVPAAVQAKNLRRRIICDIIRAEYPSWAISGTGVFVPNPDLGEFPSNIPPFSLTPIQPSEVNQSFETWLTSEYKNADPVTRKTLFERLTEMPSSEMQFWRNYNINTGGNPEPRLNQPGEYLYQILRRIDIEGTSGLEMLGDAAIGDPDGDGLMEVVDAWGESMSFRVLQVAHIQDPAVTRPDQDIWQFQSTNWALEDPQTKLPLGYQVINPIVPSQVTDIRFQVISPTIDRLNN